MEAFEAGRDTYLKYKCYDPDVPIAERLYYLKVAYRQLQEANTDTHHVIADYGDLKYVLRSVPGYDGSAVIMTLVLILCASDKALWGQEEECGQDKELVEYYRNHTFT